MVIELKQNPIHKNTRLNLVKKCQSKTTKGERMLPPRLNDISQLSPKVLRPQYHPEEHKAGILHMGIGAFHRAHQAVMTDDALAEHGGDWRIVGVSLRSKDIAEKLNAQNGLYTLIERGPSGTKARIIGSIERVIAADTKETLKALCDPSIRIVTLTVTEKGYGIDLKSRKPDINNPIVAADLATPDTPRGVLGILVAAIQKRRSNNLPPLTLLSCDNLPENGKLLRDGVVEFARLSVSPELAEWIKTHIAFPSSMVDRITPASTSETFAEAKFQTGCEDQAAVETEPYIQWVIEDNFASGRPKWEAGGALFVPDVTPHERMKLMMLNGTHSLAAYAGFLSECTYIRDVMNDPNLSQLIERHLFAAAGLLHPSPGLAPNDYAKALSTRFANPAIAHETYQIATDGTQKLPQRIFQPAVEALHQEQDLRPFAFVTAMWMRYCLCKRDDGSIYELRDPRAAEIIAVVTQVNSNAAAISQGIHDLPNLIPEELCSNQVWRATIENILSQILADGCRTVIQNECDKIA